MLKYVTAYITASTKKKKGNRSKTGSKPTAREFGRVSVWMWCVKCHALKYCLWVETPQTRHTWHLSSCGYITLLKLETEVLPEKKMFLEYYLGPTFE